MWNLLGILIAVTAFLLVFFAVFVATHPRGRMGSRLLLACVFLFTALPLLNNLLYRIDWPLAARLPVLSWIANGTAFLWGPAFLFYVRSLVFPSRRPGRRDVAHLAPFLLYWIYKAAVLPVSGAPVRPELILVGKVLGFPDILVAGAALHGLVLGYLAASFLSLTRYRRDLGNRAPATGHPTLSWLSYLVIGFGFVWGMSLANSLISYFRGSPILGACVLNIACLFVVVNGLAIKGFRQPEISAGFEPRGKYRMSSLTDAQGDALLSALLDLMAVRKPHLTPAVGLNDLAGLLGVQPRHLSRIINERLGRNFMDFLNGYRIEEAMRRLRRPESDETKILSLLYDVGFNSKASFNAAFRKHAGMTPSAYRAKFGPVPAPIASVPERSRPET